VRRILILDGVGQLRLQGWVNSSRRFKIVRALPAYLFRDTPFGHHLNTLCPVRAAQRRRP
jgi:hypothetical protein